MALLHKINLFTKYSTSNKFAKFYLKQYIPIFTYEARSCSIPATKLSQSQKSNNDIKKIKEGPGLEHFITNSLPNFDGLSQRQLKNISHPYIKPSEVDGNGRSVYIDVYGCPMNVSDAEIIWSILSSNGYIKSDNIEHADVVLIVTCSIRESSERKIWNKVNYLRDIRNRRPQQGYPLKIGVLGCMAERLKAKLVEKEKAIDIVAGPDSYRDLPRLLAVCEGGESSMNVLLSLEETYADIMPVSLSKNRLKSYVSIMRGCDNVCSYCIVPFTRGKERSRTLKTISEEIKCLSDQGVKEVVLLGQNVNSYRDLSEDNTNLTKTINSEGFSSIYKPKIGGLRFADLLDEVSLIDPEMRIRFTSPHPKDFPDEVLYLIKERPNICNCIHLPAQCGSSRILELMSRGYTRESYLKLVEHIRNIIPDVSITTDMICGFCSETEEEFNETLTLIEKVKYDFCYIYPYSMREKTKAHRKLKDDVPNDEKVKRNLEMHRVFRTVSLEKKQQQIGQTQVVLIEGFSKRSNDYLVGRNGGNTNVIVNYMDVNSPDGIRKPIPGDYVEVLINDASSQVLHGNPTAIDSLQNLYKNENCLL